MNFRTEIGQCQGSFAISHDDRIVMLGSCFSDSIGEQLELDGFNVVRNPMGPLYNPCSLARIFARQGREYETEEFIKHSDGWHCLDFASRYSDTDAERLKTIVNNDYLALAKAIDEASVVIITFGTSRVYNYLTDNTPVGNCHRLPSAMFEVEMLGVDKIVELWKDLLPSGKNVIFTLSPIRYTADGFVVNSLSKATLRVAINEVCKSNNYDYFPAFEILNDDLRDYRFYASDMKHPSETAVDYVYEHFASAYFSQATREQARQKRKSVMQQRHIPNQLRQK